MAKTYDSKKAELKPRIREYLEKSGISINTKKKPPVFSCLSHNDKNPSALIYDEYVFCPVCGWKADVFNVAEKLHGLSDFKEQLKNVEEVLGYAQRKIKTKTKKSKINTKEPFALSYDEAKGIYKKEDLQIIGKSFGEIIQAWPYTDKDNNIIGVDVRFEKEGKKQVITFWYDGKEVQTKDRPQLIYNYYEVISNIGKGKYFIIHEGCKCVDLGKNNLFEFIHTTWNGGSIFAGKNDWSFLKDEIVFILRDNDEPGLKAAKDIQKQLPKSYIIEPTPEIPEKGDIEQYLELWPVADVTGYILSFAKKKKIQNQMIYQITTLKQNLTVILSVSSESLTMDRHIISTNTGE